MHGYKWPINCTRTRMCCSGTHEIVRVWQTRGKGEAAPAASALLAGVRSAILLPCGASFALNALLLLLLLLPPATAAAHNSATRHNMLRVRAGIIGHARINM